MKIMKGGGICFMKMANLSILIIMKDVGSVLFSKNEKGHIFVSVEKSRVGKLFPTQ